MRTRRVALTLIVPSLAVVLACGLREADLDEEWDPEEDTVVIHVRNQNTRQAIVHFQQDGGIMRRLGEVTSLSERFFEEDLWLGMSVRFQIRLLAGPTHLTPEIMVSPGDTIEVTIPAHL